MNLIISHPPIVPIAFKVKSELVNLDSNAISYLSSLSLSNHDLAFSIYLSHFGKIFSLLRKLTSILCFLYSHMNSFYLELSPSP